MSMITEQIDFLRMLAISHDNANDFATAGALRQAANTIEQLAAKVRAENNVSQPCVDTIPIPDNATNGDMIKALFPNQDSDAVDSVALLGLDGYVLSTFPKSWWNAPYKRGDTE